ncbi:MAG: ATP synthase subunit C [Chromatiales bacterium]|nr:ATP synthase subunit C [Chromatiales bacterium]MDH3930649.1 ATP synthase subunit C [Chromatiales bacterium]MDH4012783.1 ATP synthase subunit C [Chromatiales bacterium]PLX54808.1 MAG: H+transporting two-sector ATPase C subunit [Chromatiales bacterium]
MKPRAKLMAFVLTLAAVLVAAATLVLVAVPATAAEAAATVAIDPAIVRWGFIAAALAAGLSALAAGYAVAQVGTAAVGALAEKPELLGRVLILVGLAEGIAIYGLIVAILIFNRIG